MNSNEQPGNHALKESSRTESVELINHLGNDNEEQDKVSCTTDSTNTFESVSDELSKNNSEANVGVTNQSEPTGDKVDSTLPTDEHAGKTKSIKIEDEDLPAVGEDGYLDILGSGDLKKRVIREGDKTRAGRGSWVTVRIVGKLLDGTVVEKYDNLSIILGDLDVVQGLDMAISLMQKGEIAEIIVASRLAYGSIGKLPNIPPDSELRYEVELLSVKDDVDEMTLSLEERIKIGNEKRERGNFWYGREAYSSAIHSYRRALDFLDEDEEVLQNPNDEVKRLIELRVIVHNNLAASQLKVEAYDAALKSVEWVLKMQPENVKALFRRGKIFAAKGMTQEAIAEMKKALRLDPESKVIHQELSKLVSQKRAEVESEKALYKRMFEQDKVKVNPKRKKKHQVALIAGSIIIAAVSVAAYYHLNSSS